MKQSIQKTVQSRPCQIMKGIYQSSNPDDSLVTGRNGTMKLAGIRIWQGTKGTLFIDAISRKGHVLNAGFMIDAKSAEKLLAQLKRGLK